MFVIANFLLALSWLISTAIKLYTWILIARVFISWVSASPYNPIVRTIYLLTEPPLKLIRRFIPYLPVGTGYLDLSPIVLLLLLQFFEYFAVKTITETALYLRRY